MTDVMFSHPRPPRIAFVTSRLCLLGLLISVATFDTRVTSAQSAPALAINPDSGDGGVLVTLTGSGFTPGNYVGSVLWDGRVVGTFTIPAGGAFARGFTIPLSSTGGEHEVAVCSGSPCLTGDFEQRATAKFTVTPGTFNVGVQAIEVTQAVRTQIPARAPQGGLVVLPSDAGLHTHVAQRRTVVRVYPWIRGGDVAPVPALSAELRGFSAGGTELPGSPLVPQNSTVMPDESMSLDDLRGEAARSWNFVLPSAWTVPGTIALRATANPPGPYFRPECAGCADDVTALPDVRFESVASVWFEAFVLRWPNVLADGSIERVTPTAGDLLDTFGYVYKTWPIADWRVRMTYHGTCTPNPTDCADPYVGGPMSPQDIQGLAIRSRGIRPGARTLFPAIQSTESIKHGSRMGCKGHAGVPNPDYWLGACGTTLAHESAHAGPARNHAGGTHGSIGAVDPMYWDPHGGVEVDAYGFDIFALQAIPPAITTHTHDYMSYGSDELVWTSQYTWRGIFDWLKAGRAEVADMSPQTEPEATIHASTYLSLGGSIRADGSASFEPAFQVDLPAGAGDGIGQGNYELDLRDDSGDTVFTRNFRAAASHAHGGVLTAGEASFIEAVPLGGRLATAVLRADGREVGRLAVSPDTPQVSIQAPTAGDQWAGAGTATVKWLATDPGGDALNIRVEGSPDGGTTWLPLAASHGGSQAEIDLADLPGTGSDWTLRVQASDGLNVGSDEVSPVVVAPKPPQVVLHNPKDGARFWPGQPIALIGQASDFDRSVDGDALLWRVDDQPVGTGEQSVAADLAPGQHTITLRAESRSGLQASASVRITVADDRDFDGLSDSWETAHGFDPQLPNASADPDADGLPNWLELEHATDPNLSDSDGDGYSDKVEIDLGTGPLDPGSDPSQLLPPRYPTYLPLVARNLS